MYILEGIEVDVNGHKVLINRDIIPSKKAKAQIVKEIKEGRYNNAYGCDEEHFGWIYIGHPESLLTPDETTELNKYLKEYIITRSAPVKSIMSKFNYQKMIRINNNIITAIWCSDDFINEESEFGDWKFTYYFSTCRSMANVSNKYKTLPQELRNLFGKQIINDKEFFVRHISFRTDDSGHAARDTVITIYGYNTPYFGNDNNLYLYEDSEMLYCKYFLNLFRCINKNYVLAE